MDATTTTEPTTAMTRVMLAGADEAALQLLAASVEAEPGMVVVERIAALADVASRLALLGPDVLVADVGPRASDDDGDTVVVGAWTGGATRVVLLGERLERAPEAARAGAHGYLLRDAVLGGTIVDTIRALAMASSTPAGRPTSIA